MVKRKTFNTPALTSKRFLHRHVTPAERKTGTFFFFCTADSFDLSNTAATDYLINDCTAIITGAELALMLLAPAVPLLQSRVNRRDEKRSHGSNTLGYDFFFLKKGKKKRFGWFISNSETMDGLLMRGRVLQRPARRMHEEKAVHVHVVAPFMMCLPGANKQTAAVCSPC